jgi:hypothetical protein
MTLEPWTKFLAPTIESLYTTPLVIWGDKDLCDMTARAMARVPYPTYLFVATKAAVVRAGPAEYLSEALLKGRSVVQIGQETLDKPEEEQIRTVLPLFALVVLQARHPADPYPPGEPYPRGDQDAIIRHCHKEMRRIDDTTFQFGMEAFHAKQKAEKLARDWLKEWEEFTRGGGVV